MHVLAFTRPSNMEAILPRVDGSMNRQLCLLQVVLHPVSLHWSILFPNASKNEIVGKGRYNWSDGSSYDGGVVGGLRSGHGTFTSADGTLVNKTRIEGTSTPTL